jgi:hypothetical protein
VTKREHIEQLAKEHGLILAFDTVDRYRGALDRRDGTVYLPDWDTEPDETYWVALHEIGHWVDLGPFVLADELIFGGRKYGTPSFSEGEARAWAWALDNALPEAFPLGQVGESNIAWSTVDYMSGHGWEPSPAFERIYEAVGAEPDWYYDVTTDAHRRKLESWAKPTWAELHAHYGVTAGVAR